MPEAGVAGVHILGVGGADWFTRKTPEAENNTDTAAEAGVTGANAPEAENDTLTGLVGVNNAEPANPTDRRAAVTPTGLKVAPPANGIKADCADDDTKKFAE